MAAAKQFMMRVEVKPELLRWARERSMIERAALAERFPRLDAWEQGELQPTLKQLEDFANATHAPIGYFFLTAPPVEHMPFLISGPSQAGTSSDQVLICWTRFISASSVRSGIESSRGPLASVRWLPSVP